MHHLTVVEEQNLPYILSTTLKIVPTAPRRLRRAYLCDDLRQSRVAHDEPPPGRDPVGLVLELLRVHFIEILEPGTVTENLLK